MSELTAAGTWVTLHAVLLPPGSRAPQVPEDTQRVPLEMRVSGVLVSAARVGEHAEIDTPAGRRLSGTLLDPAPGYTHSFGPRLAVLWPIGAELREVLRRVAVTR